LEVKFTMYLHDEKGDDDSGGGSSEYHQHYKQQPRRVTYPAIRTDIFDTSRSQAVFLRHEDELGAMGKIDHLKARLKKLFRTICFICLKRNSDRRGDLEQGSMLDSSQRQYRLEVNRRSSIVSSLRKLCCCCCSTDRSHYNIGMNISQNKMSLAMCLHWMFRVNFFFLFFLFCIFFFAMSIFFALLIMTAGEYDDECVRIGGKPITAFADAFALSWTTFSTVGYGSAYPALGDENSSSSNCLLTTSICSSESFIGVLYSGFCGAILFGKILRIQSHAQVIFSDPIVIRYGSGVETHYNDDDDDENDEKKKDIPKIPCPVLEFRIINRLFNDVGGEIIDATLTAVASIDTDDADAPNFRDGLITGGKPEDNFENRTIQFDASSASSAVKGGGGRFLDKLLSSNKTHNHGLMDDDSNARLANKRIFSKMRLEACDHPFFKRVWLARHVLDESSPVLTQRVRKLIRRNGGFWPEHYNSYEGVHESLAFGQILVSLNGVSNVSASDVYAQKIYDFVDVNVGYQFVNLLYRDGDVLKVDTDLINDVYEQNGGGGEPLTPHAE